MLVAILVLVLLRRRRRWSPAGRTPEQLALLAQAEVDRALRRAGVERPLWQPMDLFLEDLSSAPASGRRESMVADGLTVANLADAALFDPFPPSAERSQAAYEAALRVRSELNDTVERRPLS